jgi:ferredoxin
VLNTAVAESLKSYADRLENVDNFEDALHALIKKTIRDHKRIIFNGNGYSQEWQEEAARRGLPNTPTSLESLGALISEQTRELFNKYGVYNFRELESRHEVFQEDILRRISIEGGIAKIDPKRCVGCGLCSKTCPQHLLMEQDGRKIFYGCDGGWLLNETYGYMRKAQFDLMVLDCTVGDYVGDFRLGEHNSIPMIRLMLPSFATTKITTDATRIYLSHIAPSLHKPHAETEAIAGEMGCILAYDGLEIEL